MDDRERVDAQTPSQGASESDSHTGNRTPIGIPNGLSWAEAVAPFFRYNPFHAIAYGMALALNDKSAALSTLQSILNDTRLQSAKAPRYTDWLMAAARTAITNETEQQGDD